MQRRLIQLSLSLVFYGFFVQSCSKYDDANPSPTQDKRITNLVVNVTDSFGYSTNFAFNVPSGFDRPGGKVSVDTIILRPNSPYRTAVFLMNDRNNPDMDITKQMIQLSDQYLFIAIPSSDSGSGGIKIFDGSLDRFGGPFNQQATYRTGREGYGSLSVSVIKNPSNKNATRADDAGGTVIAQGLFPVWIKR